MRLCEPARSTFPEDTRTEEHDLDIHVRAYVRGSGPRTAIFLHGFPELALSWREQFAATPEGFRFIAPDMRGYGGTGAPKEVRDYAMPKLIGDVLQLADKYGVQKFDLVGHDWGGAIAWEVARLHPQRVRSLCVMNCPPGEKLARELKRPAQLKMSWYIFFFQLPFLPEIYMLRDPETFLLRVFRGIAKNKSVFTPEAIAPYVENLRAHGLPGINYYRAAMRGLRRRRPPLITVPVRLIWGMGDKALGPWFADEKLYANVAQNFSLVRLEQAGHWVQQEAPGEVNAALFAFWKSVPI